MSAILALYRANGFDEATGDAGRKDIETRTDGKQLKVGEIAGDVTRLRKGPQQKFGTVDAGWRGRQPD